jgi:centromeric protein E
MNVLPYLLMPDKVFGPQSTTPEVYDVAAKPVVKAAMEGVNGKAYSCVID